MPKLTKAETVKRVDDVARLIALGGKAGVMRRHASESLWNVSERQLQRYQARALALLQSDGWIGRDGFFAIRVARLQVLYRDAVKSGDVRLALKILREECKLLDLYPRAGDEKTRERPRQRQKRSPLRPYVTPVQKSRSA